LPARAAPLRLEASHERAFFVVSITITIVAIPK
jgi:hypothetical protein